MQYRKATEPTGALNFGLPNGGRWKAVMNRGCWFPFCKHSWTLSKPETETGFIGAKDFLDFDLNKDKQIDAQEVRAQFKGELDAKELHQFLGWICLL